MPQRKLGVDGPLVQLHIVDNDNGIRRRARDAEDVTVGEAQRFPKVSETRMRNPGRENPR